MSTDLHCAALMGQPRFGKSDTASLSDDTRRAAVLTKLQRVRQLQAASDILTQAVLADALGVKPRTLRSYMSIERGFSDDVLLVAAAALDKHCASIAAQAANLRKLIAPVANDVK